VNTFAQVEAELAAALAYPSRRDAAESESGLGTARALTSLIDQLSKAHGTPLTPEEQRHTFALALRQVDASGRPTSRQLNKPDVSYLSGDPNTPQRVNIEIETQNLRRHVNEVNRDRQAHNVFVQADPWTGAILGGLERLPGSTSMRRLTAAQAQQALTRLPAPRRDPTLTVDPRTGAQVRRSLARRPTRPTTRKPVRRGTRESEFGEAFPPESKPLNGNSVAL